MGRVLVVGGGIAGIQAALDLTSAGHSVVLVERGPALGGTMALLDRTFPTNDCSTCILSPYLNTLREARNLRIMLMSEVAAVEPSGDGYSVKISVRPRYVSTARCVGCGRCVEACPTGAVRFHTESASPHVPYIDPFMCLYLTKGSCGRCRRVCEFDAIAFEEVPRTEVVEVDRIIVATGLEVRSPEGYGEYRYGRDPRVLTLMDFEAVLKDPDAELASRKVAFILCVGSRDPHRGLEYCSRVCCMASLKQAMEAASRGAEVHIFYTDIRASGKGFEEYYMRARESVSFHRCKVSDIHPGKRLILTYHRSGVPVEEGFDYAVLAGGMGPDTSSDVFPRDAHGFVIPEEGAAPAGWSSEPCDVPGAVQSGSQRAAEVTAELGTGEVDPPPEVPMVQHSEPRIGVFVCECGTNIASVVDTRALADEAAGMPGVVWSQVLRFACSEDGLSAIKQAVKEHNLDRVVVASCSPRSHYPVFMRALEDAGLNPYMLEMANIREHSSWVHTSPGATEKAEDLVAMAVSRIRHQTPIPRGRVEAVRRVLVIGAGAAGLHAAALIARAGFHVDLLEKEDEPGGNLRRMHVEIDGQKPGDIIRGLVQRAAGAGVNLITGATLEELAGSAGRFTARISGRESVYGAVVVATGAVELDAGCAEVSGCISHMELEGMLARGRVPGRTVFLQCACSRSRREGWREYCSVVCCPHTVRLARYLRRRGSEVWVLYRDIRCTGLSELEYAEARNSGVVFINYPEDRFPEIRNGEVRVYDTVLDREVTIKADAVVAALPVVPRGEAEDLSALLRIPRDADGFFLEAHPKLRPVETHVPGIYVCGLCQYPKSLGESLAQAAAAASKVVGLLAPGVVLENPYIAEVNQRCDGCGLCVEPCPYGAIIFEEKKRKVYVEPNLCRGCGICMATCPKEAIDVRGFGYSQIMSMVETLLDRRIGDG